MSAIPDLPSAKEELRRDFLSEHGVHPSGFHPKEMAKAAERLRQASQYRTAKTLMVSLDPDLHQVRLNAVTDRKRLVLPTPGLRNGFLSVEPRFIPPGKRKSAIQPHPENLFAAKIPYEKPLGWAVDLVITESLLAGLDGSRLGDGAGHLDLQVAILTTLGWAAPDLTIVTVVGDARVTSSVPMKGTDVGVHLIVTSDRLIPTSLSAQPDVKIDTGKLPAKEIRRNDALFFLFGKALFSA